jgi:hypothetical protein
LRVGSFLLGLALSFLVGLMLHRSDLSAKLEAFGLKCDNRKEVSHFAARYCSSSLTLFTA